MASLAARVGVLGMRQCPPRTPSAAWRANRSGSGSHRPGTSLGFRNRGTSVPTASRLRQGRSRLLTQLAADISWSNASVEKKEQVGKDRFKFILDVGSDLAQGYTIPGQYVQVRCDEEQKPAFIALANAPAHQSSLVEMVIKTNDGTAGALCALGEGAEVDVSPVMGKGFPVEERAPLDTCKDVYLIATGTGIAPIRALINSGALNIKNRDSVALLYGYKDKDHCAYSEEFGAWEEMGIKLSSAESEGPDGIYVTDILTKEKLENPESVVAIIAGQWELAGTIEEYFKEQGVPEGRVLTNF